MITLVKFKAATLRWRENLYALRNRLLIGLCLGVLVMLILAFWSDLTALRAVFSAFRWEFFPLALACTLFNYALRFVKWHYYVPWSARGIFPSARARGCSQPDFRWR
jgi:hypothetical protein